MPTEPQIRAMMDALKENLLEQGNGKFEHDIFKGVEWIACPDSNAAIDLRELALAALKAAEAPSTV